MKEVLPVQREKLPDSSSLRKAIRRSLFLNVQAVYGLVKLCAASGSELLIEMGEVMLFDDTAAPRFEDLRG